MACGKLEIRIWIHTLLTGVSKSETNSNADTHASDRRDKNSKFKTFWSFGHLDFDIVSNFGFRASSFPKIIAHVANSSVKVI